MIFNIEQQNLSHQDYFVTTRDQLSVTVTSRSRHGHELLTNIGHGHAGHYPRPCWVTRAKYKSNFEETSFPKVF
jgi:hypothetical protein